MAVGAVVPVASANGSAAGMSYYISPPLVQGSFVTSDVHRVDFNSLSTGTNACVTTSGAITVLAQNCNISAVGDYGGATAGAADPTPTFGGAGSNYASTAGTTLPVTVTFSTPMKYLGFWWSAGSPSNQVTFYSGNSALLTLTTADLMGIFDTAPTSGTYEATGSIFAVDGSSYKKHHYFGNPRGYTSTTPSSPSSIVSNEPYTFIHVFVSGATTFDKVELRGGGFEFDNFVVSSSEQTPEPNLVFVGQLSPEVTYSANGGTGSMAKQTATGVAALTQNSFQRNGFVFTGWNTEQMGTGTSYLDGADYSFLTSTTLYAQWARLYTVTFDPNLGTGTMANQSSHVSANLTTNTYENSGYTFGGWNTEADGSGVSYADGDPFPFTANETLFAQWISTGMKPYEGAVLSEFSSRTVDACKPEPMTITGIRLSEAKLSVQGKALTILENTDRKVVFSFPEGLTPEKKANLIVETGFGRLTFQGAFDIAPGVCSQSLSKGRWTQIQPDGKTVKMYAKDPVGDGKIQFFVDGKELAWVNAVDESDPKLSVASGYPYLVGSVDLKPGKNLVGIRPDGVRIWRAIHAPWS